VRAELAASDPYLLDLDDDGSSVDDLIAQGYLPVGWGDEGTDSSPYGHDYQVWARTSVGPAFEALVVTVGDRQVETTETATAALAVGRNAGFVDHLQSSDTVLGLYGAWSTDIPSFRPSAAGAGDVHLAYALAVSPETACGEQLYRVDVPGCEDSNVVEDVTAVFANTQVLDDLNGNGQRDPGETYVPGEPGCFDDDPLTPCSALGIEVKNNVFIGGTTRIDGLMVVNSYLERTPAIEQVSGNVNVDDVSVGNVFHYELRGSTTFRLPDYFDAADSDAVDGLSTVNSLTIVTRNGTSLSSSDSAVQFLSSDGAEIDWGFDKGVNDPDHCTANGEEMIYQFLRFSDESKWLAQLVWQECQ
jgi:hypothetical protein